MQRHLGCCSLVSGKTRSDGSRVWRSRGKPRQAEKRFPGDPPIFSLCRTLVRSVGPSSSKQGKTQMAHYTLTVPVKYDDNGTEKPPTAPGWRGVRKHEAGHRGNLPDAQARFSRWCDRAGRLPAFGQRRRERISIHGPSRGGPFSLFLLRGCLPPRPLSGPPRIFLAR